MKTIYLDFDGVLHPTSAVDSGHLVLASYLADTIAPFECAIVISSSWRFHHSRKELVALLPCSIQDRVLGTTGPAWIGKWPRYNEILQDAIARDISYSWRALDDSWIEFPKDCSELIRCNPNFGFQAQQAQAVLRWLRA